MAKTFKIISVDENRGVMLVEFKDSVENLTHETSLPLPPETSDTPTDYEVSDYIKDFWPHTQMKSVGKAAKLNAHVGKSLDISDRVPDVAHDVRTEPPEPFDPVDP